LPSHLVFRARQGSHALEIFRRFGGRGKSAVAAGSAAAAKASEEATGSSGGAPVPLGSVMAVRNGMVGELDGHFMEMTGLVAFKDGHGVVPGIPIFSEQDGVSPLRRCGTIITRRFC
jgi:hypothetical protein